MWLEGNVDSDTAVVVVYLLGSAAFFSALISIIALLTIMRQLRSLQVYRASLAGARPHLVSTAPPTPFIPKMRPTREIPRVRLTPKPVQQWQIPIREGTPDQVVIMIEPDKEPTRQEKTITRLINHLKKLKPATS